MDIREQFLGAYQKQALDSLSLPEGLKAQYTIQSCLKDGERQVFLVVDGAGWPAVLKLQPSGREDSLRREYDLLRRLCHPQIPRPLAYLECDGQEYMVREYVEGGSLYEQVRAQGPFSPDQVKSAAMSLCQVLDYLHSQNPPVICRDVKPQNVVMDSSGRCHLIDLGAARHYRPQQQGDTVFLGTQITAPPEQFGYQQTDQRSDIYGLGMLLRFLLEGSFDPPPSLPGRRGLCRLIRRCTAFDPKDRYPSARSVLRALKYRHARLAAGAVAGLFCAGLLLSALWSPSPNASVQSSLLEDALCQQLNLNPGDPIPEARLAEVEQLLVCGTSLVNTLQEHEELLNTAHDRYMVETPHGDISNEDLSLLAKCVNLRVLILDYQQISDLSSLSGLPLEYLSLTGNQVSDLSSLVSCPGLQVLDVGENPINSAAVLSQLPALREVVLEATGITSVAPLSGSAIRYLNVRSTWVSDYTPLERCPDLTRLITGELPDGAASTLAGLTTLEELRLYSTPDIDLTLFSGLQRLRILDLYACTLSHLEALSQLNTLYYLNIGETGLEDLSFLPSLPALAELELRENPLTDLTPLLDCPWLTHLTLSSRHQALAQEQLSAAPFQISYG